MKRACVTAADLVRAARALVGVRFQLHGRSPASGLDCVGVIGATLAACGLVARWPNGYALRRLQMPDADAVLCPLGLAPVAPTCACGTIVLLKTALCQYHFAILTGQDQSAVHAHAGLRRVVEAPLPPAWPRLRHWRLAAPST